MEPPVLTPRPRTLLRDVRDGALLVEFPDASDDAANGAAVALARRLAAASLPGFRDAIPAARTLLVLFDSRVASRRAVDEAIRTAGALPEAAGDASRLIRIPVAYGGAAAADLAELARGAGLLEAEFARRHASAEYRVGFLGFAAGFGYLTGLPAELRAARLASPRPRVPAGAVAIGGPWTGVYPAEMPGGWRLIGRTSARLFDPDASRPALLAAGDRVRFDPVAAGELPAVQPAASRTRAAGERAVLRVVAAGLFATVQGAPRYGLGSLGAPPGGAMDLRSLARANGAVGNPALAPAVEIALVGPELEVLEDSIIAVAGADFGAELDGRTAPFGEAFRVRAGGRLRFPRARRGARAYLAIEGGLEETARPGEPSRRLAAEDVLHARPVPERRHAVGASSAPEFDAVLRPRVVAGPRADAFSPREMERFLSTAWRVSTMSDRRGLRLEGEPLEHARAPEIPPEGTVPGSIQVPGDGRPIVLGPDGPATGGYPKIATVIEADLPLLGQAAPGDALRFRTVTREDAEAARRE